jgi:hypothetical protein
MSLRDVRRLCPVAHITARTGSAPPCCAARYFRTARPGRPGAPPLISAASRSRPGTDAARLGQRVLDPVGEHREVVEGQRGLRAYVLDADASPGHDGQRVDVGAVREGQPDVEPPRGVLVLPHLPRGPHGHRAVRRRAIRKIKKGCFQHTQNVTE